MTVLFGSPLGAKKSNEILPRLPSLVPRVLPLFSLLALLLLPSKFSPCPAPDLQGRRGSSLKLGDCPPLRGLLCASPQFTELYS